jgi:hypothetical protein
MRLRLFDYVALVVSLLAVTSVGIFAYAGGGPASQVVIQTEDATYLYPLDQDRTVEVTGPIGATVIEILDGEVRVANSDCRDKICVAAGWLDSAGEWAACMPNRVFVRVEGDEVTGEVDAYTY